MTTTIPVRTHDDGQLDGYLALPAGGQGPGVIVLQEIFGVGDYIKGAADRLAQLGYVALAPDLYWRLEPNAAPADIEEAFQLSQRLDHANAVKDAVSALDALRGRPEVTDTRAGVLGFCLGGTLAFQVAIQGDPDAAVCYYGSGIPDVLDQAGEITCPVLFHFGGADQYIPREQIDQVAQSAAAHPNMECHIQEDAGHAFDNPSPMFHHPGAAEVAWQVTAEFLARTLGTGTGTGTATATGPGTGTGTG